MNKNYRVRESSSWEAITKQAKEDRRGGYKLIAIVAVLIISFFGWTIWRSLPSYEVQTPPQKVQTNNGTP